MLVRRPLFISAVCIFYFLMNLVPTAPLLAKAMELISEFAQGGASRFYSAFKASINSVWVMGVLKVLAFDVALIGMWCMRRWGLFLFSGFLGHALFLQAQAGSFSPFSTGMILLALGGSWYFFFSGPKAKYIRPEVHYYGDVSREGLGKAPEPAEDAPKSAIDQLLY